VFYGAGARGSKQKILETKIRPVLQRTGEQANVSASSNLSFNHIQIPAEC
jgi:hypothetical protein